MPQIISVGGIAVDIAAILPRLPRAGDCVTATALEHGLGGKAANQAVAAARLEGEVAIVGSVGSDAAGAFAVGRLAAEGVATDAIRRDPAAATATCILQKDSDGRRQVAVFPGANSGVTAALIDTASALLQAARVVMVQLEIPLDGAGRAIELARAGGAEVLLDPSPVRALPRELLRSATIIRANAKEAAALTGIAVQDRESARAAAGRLRESGARLVVIEAGGQGNLFATAEEEVLVPLYEVTAVDATGAGDALAGAFAVAVIERMSLREAGRFATAAAALTTRAVGAQAAMPRRHEIERLLRG
jgi:ribokinase